MEKQSSNFICIFDWKKDKIILSYSDKLESWEICHIGECEVTKSIVHNLLCIVLLLLYMYSVYIYVKNT